MVNRFSKPGLGRRKREFWTTFVTTFTAAPLQVGTGPVCLEHTPAGSCTPDSVLCPRVWLALATLSPL